MPPKKATVAAASKAKAVPKTVAASQAKTTKTAATKKTDTKPAATTKRAAANAKKAEEPEESKVEDAAAPKIKTKQTATITKKKAAPKRKSDETAKEEESESEREPAPKKSKTAPVTKKTAATKKTTAAAKKTPAAKNTATTKKAAVKKTDSDKENQDEDEDEDAKPKANTKRKRAAEAEESADEKDGEEIRPKKQPRTRKAPPPRLIPKRKILKKINSAPETVLDVFVFGEGSAGELGLGNMKVDGKKPIDVKRPRLNPTLSSANVVQISCGGMHGIALTKDNKILTWGVNDQGSLGRDTTWEGGLRDVDAEESDSDDDDDDSGLNPKESTPAEVDMSGVEEDTKFVQVVASDSASFALTEEGKVYGWGTFRANDGILGFTEDIDIQRTPMLLPELKGITQLAAGANHILALDNKGKVQAWGSGQQSQLARRVFEGHMKGSLRPAGIGNLPVRGAKAVKIATGSYHSFVIDDMGRVFSWGLNSFGETGIPDNAGEDAAVTQKPTHVESLSEYKIKDIAGGGHHSLACTEDGKLLTWGRIDGHQVGLPMSTFNEDNAEFDEHGRARILLKPTVVEKVKDAVFVESGTDNCFAITSEGKTYSWGFSANFQTGLGTDDDVEEPTLIDNTAVRDKKIIWAGAGGQYSILASAQRVASSDADTAMEEA